MGPSPTSHWKSALLSCVLCIVGLSPSPCIAVTLAVTAAESATARVPDSEIASAYEVFFTLSAEARGRRLDADIEVVARLEMRPERRPDGGIDFVLVRELQPATKFYAVDPAGPFGDEVKMAAVTTLPEGSWAALAEARGAIEQSGRSQHAAWSAKHSSERPFDGAFAFLVIGPADGRFRITQATDGRIAGVTNELTDRWMSGPIDPLFARWDEHTTGELQHGYWFWNQGEQEPFDYEPHVYHALVRALQLLDRPFQDAAHESITAELLDVVLTLAPKAEGRITPTLKPVSMVPSGPGSATSSPASNPRVEVYRALGDARLAVDWKDEELRLELQVGIRPLR